MLKWKRGFDIWDDGSGVDCNDYSHSTQQHGVDCSGRHPFAGHHHCHHCHRPPTAHCTVAILPAHKWYGASAPPHPPPWQYPSLGWSVAAITHIDHIWATHGETYWDIKSLNWSTINCISPVIVKHKNHDFGILEDNKKHKEAIASKKTTTMTITYMYMSVSSTTFIDSYHPNHVIPVLWPPHCQHQQIIIKVNPLVHF